MPLPPTATVTALQSLSDFSHTETFVPSVTQKMASRPAEVVATAGHVAGLLLSVHELRMAFSCGCQDECWYNFYEREEVPSIVSRSIKIHILLEEWKRCKKKGSGSKKWFEVKLNKIKNFTNISNKQCSKNHWCRKRKVEWLMNSKGKDQVLVLRKWKKASWKGNYKIPHTAIW